ncbi:MAG: methionine synthase [Deltaproteobacteria bacterium]|nr:methionine synthase [Deltaproteobacteria bacterium]
MSELDRKNRVHRLLHELQGRVLVLDGAMGTALQQKNLTAEDFGGPEFEGCNEYLVMTRPEAISSVHEAYLEAGADIVETDTFGATPLVLAEYGLQAKAYEINLIAAKLARSAAEKYSSAEKPRFVAGSIGPTTKAISVTGGVTFEELIDNFAAQAKALYDGGVDYFLLETCQDTRNVKAGILGIQRVLDKEEVKIPIAVSITIEPMGTMLAGQGVEALAASLEHVELLYVGLNCATGPEFMTDHIRTLAGMAGTRIACVPNAGLPDEEGRYLENPEMVAAVLRRFGEAGWVNLLGGCCGTHAGHIRALSQLAAELKPRAIPEAKISTLSGIDYLEVTDDKRPVLVGERTNVIGSRKFKNLIIEEKFEEAAEIGRAQVKQLAQIVDLCLANPDRDEYDDMKRFLEEVVKKVRVPLMIDSTDARVLEMALTYSQGKAIINSINLEDGEERFDHVVPLARKFGAALVVGTIDEDKIQGMGVSRERKLQIARRSYDLLVNRYGVKPQDIYFDLLVFPVGTGDEQYKGSAVETIEGIRLVKEAFPECKTILGVSNVSFGLPAAGREVLNSVYLYHCVKAGLDLAIVNTEKLERYASIPEEEKKLADDLLWNRGEDPIAAFANHFREASSRLVKSKESLPLEERLPRYIIEGTKEGLREDLDEALKKYKPLEIINGPLMRGMDEVGRLFNNNELIVAEVLQSAEAMKAAVSHLEPFMDKTDSAGRGKVILATVKGDVHDIGKNLVDIILSNNGFNVVNLGIKIPPEQLIAAIHEHKPDIVGLSGLLVKSAEQMVLTAGDLSKAGIQVPVLVGGAALSEKFTDNKIARAYEGFVAYANDAMTGLELAKRIRDPHSFSQLKAGIEERRRAAKQDTYVKVTVALAGDERSKAIDILETLPKAPDFERHVVKNTPIDQIWDYLNPLMLYGRHLGMKGALVKLLEAGNLKALKDAEGGEKAIEVYETVEALKVECRQLLKPKAVFQFFQAGSEGNRISILDERGGELARIVFPRQAKPEGLCLADYVRPLPLGRVKGLDSLAMFVVGVGEGVRELAEQWKLEGKYLQSHAFQALALETAEAYAEYLHARLRTMWGFPDPLDTTMMQRFQAKYRGKRYSFGYPACPNLEEQKPLFQLLKPEEIGVELTEGFMMEPEASVSAIVFHHPQASYFGVGES